MPAYVIIEIRLTDAEAAEALSEYTARTAELLRKAGVTTRAFDRAPRVLEGGWRPEALIVQEFRDMAAVDRFYGSAEYAPLRALRASFSSNRVVAVEGPPI